MYVRGSCWHISVKIRGWNRLLLYYTACHPGKTNKRYPGNNETRERENEAKENKPHTYAYTWWIWYKTRQQRSVCSERYGKLHSVTKKNKKHRHSCTWRLENALPGSSRIRPPWLWHADPRIYRMSINIWCAASSTSRSRVQDLL